MSNAIPDRTAAGFLGLRTRLKARASAYEVEGGASRMIPMEGLRGLAVLLVFFVHYHALFGEYLVRGLWLRSISQFLGTIGNSGVDLFFVMSGYLIYGALIRREVGYFRFARRRVQRIYPTFLSVFVGYLVLSLAFPQQSKIPAGAVAGGLYVLQNLFLLPGIFRITPMISVAWSLSFEFFFYLTLPILIAACGMRRWKAQLRLAFFALLWGSGGIALVYRGQAPQARMISFIAGIVLYEVISVEKIRVLVPKRGEMGVLLLVLLSFFFFYTVHGPRSQSKMNAFLPVFSLGVSFFFLCLYSFKCNGALSRAFSWTPFRYLGNMSYSYYLIHGLTLQAVAKVFGFVFPTMDSTVALLALVIGFSATWISSSFLFFLVEKRYSLEVKRPQVLKALSATVALGKAI
ncbi:MAG: acyltransferase [Acidobacteria bacterium]|nr:MAG: acyltransferase [Acidobacteriota bacterium]